jgi:hypothetical protein
MGMNKNKQHFALATVVLLHLVITLAHGSAHSSAGVPLNLASLVFVVAAIVVAPLAGLALMWKHALYGGRLIGVAMAASLLFGLINHFVIPSPDHVAHVAPQWRPLFVSTAVMLAVTEAAGAILGLTYRSATRRLA